MAGKKHASYIISFSNNWKDLCHWLFKRDYNWYDFTLVRVHVMRDVVKPGFEIDLALLGLGLHFRYNLNPTGSKAAKALAQFRADHPEFYTDEPSGEDDAE